MSSEIKKEVGLERKLEQAKALNNLLSLKYKQLLKESASMERMIETIDQAVPALPWDVYKPKVKIGNKKSGKKEIKESLILSLADPHVGEIVRPEETLGFGDYKFEKFQRRMEYYVDVVQMFQRDIWTTYQYGKLVLFCLGDWVSGLIHEELKENADGSVMEAVLSCVAVMEKVILDLLTGFPEVELNCVVGNHGRFEKKWKNKRMAQNSFDRVCYEMLRARFRNMKNIKVNISEAPYMLVDVEGWRWLIMHGSSIRGWAGVPYYGIQREIKKWGDLFGIRQQAFQYAMIAHLHVPYVLPRPGFGKIFGCGSIIGTSEFSLQLVDTPVPASQWMLGVHHDIGVTNQIDVYLDKPPKKDKYRYNLQWGILP